MKTVEEFLEHFGVAGMHWGVRKSRGGKVTRQSVDSKRAKELKARPVGSLSNKQLKDVNERLNLETNYKRLNPSTIAKGRKAATEITATVGAVTALAALATNPAAQRAVGRGISFLKNSATWRMMQMSEAQDDLVEFGYAYLLRTVPGLSS
jgi:hypothetical protein